MRKIIFICLNLLTISLLAQGPIDGYMKGANKTDIAISFNQEKYDTYRFGTEPRTEINTIQSASLFLEHGFSDSLDLVFTVPFMRTPTCEFCEDYNQGVQDGTLHLKYRFSKTKKENRYSKAITAIGISTPFSNYPDTIERPLGARNTVFQGRFLTQQDFFNGLFFQFQTGIDFRFAPSSQLAAPLMVKLGFAGNRIFTEGFLEYYHTFNSSADNQIFGGAGSKWLKSGITVYYSIQPNFGVFVKGAFILGGENIGISDTYGFGAAYRIRWK